MLLCDPALGFFILLYAQRDPHTMYAILFCRLNQQKAPSAPYIKQGHPFLQIQFFQNIIYFVFLSLIKRILLIQKIAARIAHSLVQPELIKVISDVIMALHFSLLVLLLRGCEYQFFQSRFICRELVHLP